LLGAAHRNRTDNLPITNRVLYRIELERHTTKLHEQTVQPTDRNRGLETCQAGLPHDSNWLRCCSSSLRVGEPVAAFVQVVSSVTFGPIPGDDVKLG
jgi:hypothetical protein